MESTVLLMLTHLFLPIVAIGGILLISWWTIPKLRGATSLSISEELKDAASRTVREAVRLTEKSFCAAVAATKAIREEFNHRGR